MPNNIGAVAQGVPNTRLFTAQFIDADGELTAYPLELAAAVTDPELNAFLDAIGVATNASLYSLLITEQYGGLPVAGNAVNAAHTSVKDQIVILWKDPTLRKSQRVYVPAPNQANFLANTDTPDTVAAQVVAIQTASAAALPASYDPVSIRFTQSKKINERVRF